MDDNRERGLAAARDRQQQYLLDPWKFSPILLPPCVVKILMVTDSGGHFGVADFGLQALLDALATPPGPWVRFEVTKAHRRTDADADLQNFTFDGTDLTAFDQMWLVAVERNGSDITDSEVAAIARFMDGGGGVFATGDHEDLGVAMCGRIPRVRSMRKWHYPSPGPNGEPVAPSGGGPDRHDTLSAGNDPGVQFEDQSDDVPQRISPRMYHSWSWNPFYHKTYPHPVLCGPRGVIRVLPDHPHEGECYVPSDLSAVLTYDGYACTEYPGGLPPEVIAWSTIQGNRSATDVKGVLNAKVFGAIGAYDGHRQDVGRVVVDATWHHFFDINLVGQLFLPDPIKSVGFDATPAGHAAYEEIKSYFRNIAVWLASEHNQAAMWWRALWWCRWNHRLAMDLRPGHLDRPETLDLDELLRIGGEAHDALGLAASRCTVRRWIIWYLIRPRWPKIWEQLGPVIDPWAPVVGDRAAEELTAEAGLQADLLVDAALGAAVYALGTRFRFPDEQARRDAGADDLDRVLGDVLTEHLRRAGDLAADRVEGASRFAERTGRNLRG